MVFALTFVTFVMLHKSCCMFTVALIASHAELRKRSLTHPTKLSHTSGGCAWPTPIRTLARPGIFFLRQKSPMPRMQVRCSTVAASV